MTARDATVFSAGLAAGVWLAVFVVWLSSVLRDRSEERRATAALAARVRELRA